MIFLPERDWRGGRRDRRGGGSHEADARWALGLVVGLGVAVYVGVITWQQALGVLGYFVWVSVMLAAGLALTLVSMALTGVSLELFEWFCKKFPVLGPVVGRVFYVVPSALILVFAAVVAWHVASDMVGLAWSSPGTVVVGLLAVLWFPLVSSLVVLARRIWRRYRPAPPRGRAADLTVSKAKSRSSSSTTPAARWGATWTACLPACG